jgi:chromosomal replication initiator protein
VAGGEGPEVRLLVPTRFMRDWIHTHYVDLLSSLWAVENPSVESVELVVGVSPSLSSPSLSPSSLSSSLPLVSRPETQEAKRQEPKEHGSGTQGTEEGRISSRVVPRSASFSSSTPSSSSSFSGSSPFSGAAAEEERENIGASLDPRFTFENFVVGKPNELAHAAARKVSEAKQVTFNPLFLYSGVGLGKTHLMHAIAWAIRRQDPSRRVVYLSAEKFMYQFVRALRFRDTMAFKEQYRSVDILMIDDVQFISGKESTQEEFFHTFNALVDQNRQVIISADKSPSDLEGMEERLKSRLGWGLVADIHPTTYELRLGILQSKAQQLGTDVNPKVLEFLAHRISSNVRELEGALNRIVAHAELIGRPITLDMTQEVLRDQLRAHDRRMNIDDIQRKVAEHFNIRLADMASPRRSRAVARPRQVAMYLCKKLTQRSLPEIGRKFGGRDHTTVIHAVRKVEELMGSDVSFAEDVELLQRMLEG